MWVKNITNFGRFCYLNIPCLGIYSYFEKGCRKKVHATIPKGIVGDFEITVLHRNFERMAREAMDCVSDGVLKRSSKSRLDSYNVRNSVWVISHITFLEYRVYFFPTTFLEIAVYHLNPL